MQASRTNQQMNGFPVPDALLLKPSQPVSRKILLSIVPLTPAPITGPDAWIGWGRIAVYGGLAMASFKKSRPLSYGFWGATAVSLMTSMSAEALNPPAVPVPGA